MCVLYGCLWFKVCTPLQCLVVLIQMVFLCRINVGGKLLTNYLKDIISYRYQQLIDCKCFSHLYSVHYSCVTLQIHAANVHLQFKELGYMSQVSEIIKLFCWKSPMVN